MSRVEPNKYPSLTVTDNPSIGTPYIQVHDPLGSFTTTMRVDSSRRFDIYQEFVSLNLKLDMIIERLNMPWYKRLYNWMRSLL